MMMTRTGSERNHGSSCAVAQINRVDWHMSALSVTCENVKDFNTPSHHNWTLSFDAAELHAILDKLARIASTSEGSDGLRTSLAASADSLRRLADIFSGQSINTR